MKDAAADISRDWLTLLFAGLGITFAPHEWLGGLFLALAGASFARHMDPEQDRRELWAVMLGAFLASHLAALVWSRWPDGWFTLTPPVQVVMMATGFFSRRLTRFVMRLAGLIEKRTDTIADRLIDRILPGTRPLPPTSTPLIEDPDNDKL